MGYPVVPLARRSKALAYKGASVLSLDGIVHHWQRMRYNIGLWLNDTGILVFDTDGPDGEEFVQEHGIDSNTIVRTPSGGRHIYTQHAIENFRSRYGFLGKKLDIKGTGGLVAGGSETEDGKYMYECGPRHPKLLPLCPEHVQDMIRQDLYKPPPTRPVLSDPPRDIQSMERYVSKIPPAISGQSGHKSFFVACLKMARLTTEWDTFLYLVSVYNETKCEPPFNERDTMHKAQDAWKSVYS